MARVMFTCPESAASVFTGISMEQPAFATATIVTNTVSCSSCGSVHLYEKRDTYLEGDPPAPAPKPLMLRAHFEAAERHLLQQRELSAHAGHPNTKGSPREEFVREFLRGHVGTRLGIGTGEIIDPASRTGDRRHQIDVVIHRDEYPRLALGGEVSVFLAESVVATIEVKSTLSKQELQRAVIVARDIKQLGRGSGFSGLSAGYLPPGILCYVVAYVGPAKMKTVRRWLEEIHAELGVDFGAPLPAQFSERWKCPAPTLDGVFVLGTGFVMYDNASLTLRDEEYWEAHPDHRWVTVSADGASLMTLFLLVTSAASGVGTVGIASGRYIADSFFSVEDED